MRDLAKMEVKDWRGKIRNIKEWNNSANKSKNRTCKRGESRLIHRINRIRRAQEIKRPMPINGAYGHEYFFSGKVILTEVKHEI